MSTPSEERPTAGEMTDVELSVNGRLRRVSIESRWTLADVLRDRLGLTGTHLGCEHGVCGACTVLLDGAPVRSCLLFAIACEDRDITTIEGIDHDPLLVQVQDAIVEEQGLQCGFCTPGFVMLLAGLAHIGWSGDDDEVATVVSSNICRCTGYQGLLRAAGRLLNPPATSTGAELP